MLSEPDGLIHQLKVQLAWAASCEPGVPSVMPLASDEQIDTAEAELGFELPPLLKRIYCEIGNGGRHLGPGYGLIGVSGGFDNGCGWNIIKTSEDFSEGLEWWDQIIVVCDWGCATFSCVDCSDEDFTVYRWDGNAFDEETDPEDPSEEFWSIEADTFDEWILTPNLALHQ